MPRITIRLSDTLYDRLRLFAAGRARGSPELAVIVREALETYLSHQVRLPDGRQFVPRKGRDGTPTVVP